MGGTEQKEKSGLPRPSYLGSLNAFQIKTKGLPWTCSRRGAVFQEICSLASPHPHRREGKSMEQSLAASPATSAGGFVYIPSQANPSSPSWGIRGIIHLQGPPPERKQQSTRQEGTAWPHLLLWGWGLSSLQTPSHASLLPAIPAPTPPRPFKQMESFPLLEYILAALSLSAIHLTTN